MAAQTPSAATPARAARVGVSSPPSPSPAASGGSAPLAGPSKPPAAATTDLWTDILRSADRQQSLGRKNVVLLAERNRGRSHLLDRLVGKRRGGARPDALAVGYDVLQAADEEDAAPPVSVFYPPSSHPTLLRLIDVSLPPRPLPDTAVVIVLDWTKPSSMIKELLTWLLWVDAWAARVGGDGGEGDELRAKLQSHLQHYAEPAGPAAATAPPASLAGVGPLLPLGQGTLTLNPHGVPIVVVCTRADQMDAVGDEMGMKGGGWEERTDWIQQVLRTVCLAYGAALFYTAPTQEGSYALLREYLFHRLYASPASETAPARFPFRHKANALDRDAVMVPAGWDSYGKINVLREGFDPARVARAWDASVAGSEAETIEDLWTAMIPDTERPKAASGAAVTTTSEGEQAFLARQLDVLTKDPNRDPRAQFRAAAAAAGAGGGGSSSGNTASEAALERFGGVVGPMGGGGLSLPGVEKAMAEMEGAVDESKDRARLARRFQGLLKKPVASAAAPTSPTKAAK
ncbi:hypothetical protein Q8F55_006722 [Vanrija albida]|uniref:Dynein light intermediate chain n=1 Tax=Vanrija albida TaxID=181172 RepID=A0ABR3PXX9_9TREE